VATFADSLGLGPVVVVGHSRGSVNAQRFAIDYPERLLGLVLVGSFATFRGNPTMIDLWQTSVSQLTDPIDPGFVREFQKSTLAQPISPAFLDTVVQESLKVPAHVWRAGHTLFPSRSGHLPTAIAGAQLVVYENAGHALHWEEPERFAADLVAFVRSFGI
jgi:non-heme chloroperoxidase